MIRRMLRLVVFGVLLGLLALVVPDGGRTEPGFALLKVETAHDVDAGQKVMWFLALGSDARPGESILGSRSDAIQLVGINTVNGHAVTIGVPRDSWVDIPGVGNDKINAAMVYGGPQLTAQAVANLVGITPDYVFVTSFRGVIAMAHAIGGITVRVRWDVTTNLRHYRPGPAAPQRAGGSRLRPGPARSTRRRLRPVAGPELGAPGRAAPAHRPGQEAGQVRVGVVLLHAQRGDGPLRRGDIPAGAGGPADRPGEGAPVCRPRRGGLRGCGAASSSPTLPARAPWPHGSAPTPPCTAPASDHAAQSRASCSPGSALRGWVSPC